MQTEIICSSHRFVRQWKKKDDVIRGYVVGAEGLKEFEVALGELTDDEREIILKGCLINYNRK